MFLSLILAALTRAELLDIMRTPPKNAVSGLVCVYANCPADMRDEFHTPVTRFVSKTCESLYSRRAGKMVRFTDPGIVVYIGDGRTNDTSVVDGVFKRDDKTPYTRIFLPSPGYSDLAKFRLSIAKAFALALDKRVIDDAEAQKMLRNADPKERVAHQYAEIDRWLKGQKTEADDEGMLKLCRRVIDPGHARVSDVLRFASRLYLYPAYYAYPFAGKFRQCTFSQAVDIMQVDPFVRFAALEKSSQVVLYGGGRGEFLIDAASAYSAFLMELARAKKSRQELLDMLEDADLKLNIALEEARKFEQGAKK